jgi:3-hydroxyisobutyrate dehydrogenase-like beta-hydroxyacid dehydrogenase
MSTTNGGSKDYDVAVIGCGLMGSALARAFANSGRAVAAWNRTYERAEALAVDGVTPVRSIEDAVASAQLVVACTATYDTTRSALDAVADWGGAPLVNIGTSTPDEAETMDTWARARGLAYLDGAILAYPQDIGSAGALLLFSGSRAVWSEHEQTLMSLGGASRHVSELVQAAAVLELGIVGAFYVSALSAYVEAATYAQSQGVPAEALHTATRAALESLRHTTEEAAAAIESGNHETASATLSTYAEGSRAGLAAMHGAGLRARLLTAAVESMEAAEAAGFGELGFYVQTRVAQETDRWTVTDKGGSTWFQ